MNTQLLASLKGSSEDVRKKFEQGFNKFISQAVNIGGLSLKFEYKNPDSGNVISCMATRYKVVMLPSKTISALEAFVTVGYVTEGLISERLFQTLIRELVLSNRRTGEISYIEGGDAATLTVRKGDITLLFTLEPVDILRGSLK
jgi:hypothetical protein